MSREFAILIALLLVGAAAFLVYSGNALVKRHGARIKSTAMTAVRALHWGFWMVFATILIAGILMDTFPIPQP